MSICVESAASVAQPQGKGDALPRVVHCIPNLVLGGAQRAAIEIVRSLSHLGVQQQVVVLGGDDQISDWPGLPIQPCCLGYRGSRRDVRGRQLAVRRLRELLASFGAEVLHTHLWPAAAIGGQAARGTGVAHVVHVQDTRPWVAERSLRAAMLRWSMRRSLRSPLPTFVAVSQAAWEFNAPPLGIQCAPHEIIPNGVNLEEFTPADRATDRDTRRIVLGLATRFHPEKGHNVLLHAVATLVERGHSIELRLAGEGGVRGECEALVRQLGLQKQVRFLGAIQDVPSFLQQLDIFVHPSLACEGMPLSILEAMAVRLPVVATDVAGTNEVIKHGDSGLIVPPGDVPSLTSAIEKLVADSGERARIAERGRDVVRSRYSWTAIAEDLLDFYSRVLARGKVTAG